VGAASVSSKSPFAAFPFPPRESIWSDLFSLRRLANVAGTQEPIYGPSAIKSVAEETATTPYTELTRDDLRWEALESTCVETQTFYFMSEGGQLAFCQVIYSSLAYALTATPVLALANS
jgi:Svf1-like.